MATPNYNAFITKVRDWSNRDAGALPDPIIMDGLKYAADVAYRDLEIPALEQNQYWMIGGTTTTAGVDNDIPNLATVQATYPNAFTVQPSVVSAFIAERSTIVKLPVPGDTTQFMHLRNVGPLGNEVQGDGTVYNEKTDTRTFWDATAFKRNTNRWTRQGSDILLAGYFSSGDVIELFYYRRLAALAARYEVSPNNYAAGFIVSSNEMKVNTADTQPTGVIPSADSTTGSFPLYFPTGTTVAQVQADVLLSIPGLTPVAAADSANTVEVFMFGTEVPNWLRDENERAILFGALWQCFDYLADIEMSQLYFQKFTQTIVELNEEEGKRHASGGNVQVNYSNSLLSHYF